MGFMNLMFTVIPPPVKWPQEKVERKAYEVANILKSNGIKVAGFPEVIDETRNGTRTLAYQPKMDNREFACKVKEFFCDVEIIIYKVTPIISREELHRWVDETVEKYGINQIVFVGGESSRKQYPGINPVQAAEQFGKYSIKIGGITIFTREDEVKKLIYKTKAGMGFFISQIVFELDNARRVIEEYDSQCEQNSIVPSPIYISIAPLASIEDYEFLKWLGVEFPEETEQYLKEDNTKIEARTTEILENLINHLREVKWKCGINVEHVLYNNLQLASYLIYRLNKILV